MIYHLAQVILPSSQVDNRNERLNKFKILFFYLIGIQYPLWVIKDDIGNEIEMRISGNYFKPFGGPGLVWMRPHQVVGLSVGVNFNRVDGQGVLFTKQYERPITAVDLRTHLRVSEVKTVTRNGVPVTVVVFTSFTLGQKEGDPENPEYPIDKRIGNFFYSSERIKKVLGTVGVRSITHDENETISWDEWVIKQVENAARLVVSERDLNELWHPRSTDLGASASQEMADQLFTSLERGMKSIGVRLFGARIVNFKLDEKDPIAKQRIENWREVWKQNVDTTIADADAHANADLEGARADSKADLLDAIASIFSQLDGQNLRDLPQHVIALYFIHALEEYVRKQPTDEESAKKIQTIKDFFLYNRTEG
jgi:hypothetical protein